MSSTDGEAGVDTQSISVLTHGIDQLSPGMSVYAYYRSNRGKKKRKETRGEITTVTPISTGKARFRFYDPELERKIEITIDESLDACRIRSKKTGTWSTLGSPVLVLASDEYNTPDEVKQAYVVNRRNRSFESVVAAAKIKQNEEALKWLLQQ